MISTKAIKTTAIQTLNDHWPWSMAVSGVALLCIAVLYYCGRVLLNILGAYGLIPLTGLMLFLAFPVLLGMLRCFWRLAGGVRERPMAVLHYFSSFAAYKRAALFSACFGGILLLMGGIFCLPGLVVKLFADGTILTGFGLRYPVLLSVAQIFSYILLALGAFCLVLRGSRLYLAPFLLVTVENESPRWCLERAGAVGLYTSGEYLSHFWSFCGWILLSCLFVPLLFTAPYLCMSYAVDCRYGIAYYNRVGTCGTDHCPIYRA